MKDNALKVMVAAIIIACTSYSAIAACHNTVYCARNGEDDGNCYQTGGPCGWDVEKPGVPVCATCENSSTGCRCS